MIPQEKWNNKNVKSYLDFRQIFYPYQPFSKSLRSSLSMLCPTFFFSFSPQQIERLHNHLHLHWRVCIGESFHQVFSDCIYFPTWVR